MWHARASWFILSATLSAFRSVIFIFYLFFHLGSSQPLSPWLLLNLTLCLPLETTTWDLLLVFPGSMKIYLNYILIYLVLLSRSLLYSQKLLWALHLVIFLFQLLTYSFLYLLIQSSVVCSVRCSKIFIWLFLSQIVFLKLIFSSFLGTLNFLSEHFFDFCWKTFDS